MNKLTYVVRQLIRNYLQLNSSSDIFNQDNIDPYKESKATLLGDIHRVRRYFYYVAKRLDLTSYLDRRAIDLAIDEIRKTYDDDGNVLINIQNYLRTFSIKTVTDDPNTIQKKRQDWANQLVHLNLGLQKSRDEVNEHQAILKTAKKKVEISENHYKIIIDEEKDVNEKVNAKLNRAQSSNTKFSLSSNWIKDIEDANNMKSLYQEKKKNAEHVVEKDRLELKKQNDIDLNLNTKIEDIKSRIEGLENTLKLNLEEEDKKLKVKYGRGLLLYGPPGTGKKRDVCFHFLLFIVYLYI